MGSPGVAARPSGERTLKPPPRVKPLHCLQIRPGTPLWTVAEERRGRLWGSSGGWRTAQLPVGQHLKDVSHN